MKSGVAYGLQMEIRRCKCSDERCGDQLAYTSRQSPSEEQIHRNAVVIIMAVCMFTVDNFSGYFIVASGSDE
jgi:hypothetical protein